VNALRARSELPRALTSRPVLVAGGVGLSLVAGWLVTYPSGLRLALVGGTVGLIIGFSVVMPRYLLYGLIVWVALLGLIRRLVSVPSQGSRLDPLLLVAPLALVVLVAIAARRGAFRHASALSKAVVVLSLLAVAGSINPLQGGLQTGVAGLLFVLVPLLAFWVGRGLCDDSTLTRLLKLVAVLAVGAGMYGLVQTFWHFPSWDAAWIRNSGYMALNVGGTIRAFGTFSSAQEYALFLAVGIGVLLMFGLKGARFPLAVAAVGILGVALFYESSRSAVVSLVLALGIVVGARRRFPLVVGAAVGGIFLLGLLLVASKFNAPGVGTSSASALATHQLQGLADPLNPTSSSLLGHLAISGHGLRSALVYPLGLGTGSVSIAAAKFGGLTSNTELDPSNMAVALGIPGLLAYLAVLILGLSKAYRLASTRRDALPSVVLCLLVVTLFQWLNGGLYAVAFLPWLVLGWADRVASGGAAVVVASQPTVVAGKAEGAGREP
jgi:hypothetical protein